MQSLKNELNIKQRIIDEKNTALRDQNEADLFLSCEKIKNEVLNGKKKEEIQPQINGLINLQQRQAMLAKQQYNYSDLFGLENIYGNRNR